ncbi:hypothetical protein [Engelhardtia mirabilis]|uniref:PET hydrolase/cutinase-like domain-containing protein n=1 Tax=Engelhardtia mirabilis TaxID=2528011 RepID=A0A518BS05_9BACT|nr:hypothetical protein Pla133_48620 [Planctomycetes bacterium Pla133]QDV04066.1 hypothetical protein Pla86_48600 [Planctomycetes bacterium Pla86]
MRHLPAASPCVLATAALAGLALTAQASDLTLDGRTSTVAQLGSSLAIELTGAPGQVALVGVDVSPGPVDLFGQSIPIGLTPAFAFVGDGPTDGSGSFGFSLVLPSDPALDGVTFYLVGVLADPTGSAPLDFSGSADVTLTVDLAPVADELVGVSRPALPHFDWITTVREGDPLEFAVDPGQSGFLAGQSGTAYVTADRTRAQWNANPALVDLSGDGPDAIAFPGGAITQNRFTVDAGTLSGDAGASLGVGYDLVIDLDGDGQLSNGDLIDGYDGAGFFVARDPSLPGPFAVTEILYSGGQWLGQNLFYPTNIAELDNVPVVIVSHGNGHNYQWYDHIGNHLASYGYVVMSHENNTGPGIGTASTTTLTNTDYFYGNLATIAGGALVGKLDKSRTTWIGHSRGGEGIVRAYDKLFDGVYVPTNFSIGDITLLSSIAPTVFFGKGNSAPHAVDYHLWVGAGDSDVSGCVVADATQSFQLYGRAENERAAISLYGVGHGWFHNGGGSAFVNGPCQIGRPETHRIMRGYLLPLVEFHVRGNPAAKDWLWRQYEDLHPQSKPDNPCIVANIQWTEGAETGKLVIDDFQGDADPFTTVGGALVTTDLVEWEQSRLQDDTTSLTYDPLDIMNGMTYGQPADKEAGAVLRFDGLADYSLVYDLPAAQRDWSGHRWLTFRTAQRTRDPLTTALLADEVFEVRLVDTAGHTSTLRVDALLAGIEEPYQRSGCGSGVGWINDFESVRLGLRGFAVAEPELDLGQIERLEFLFGPSHGSTAGSLGLDDIELQVE